MNIHEAVRKKKRVIDYGAVKNEFGLFAGAVRLWRFLVICAVLCALLLGVWWASYRSLDGVVLCIRGSTMGLVSRDGAVKFEVIATDDMPLVSLEHVTNTRVMDADDAGVLFLLPLHGRRRGCLGVVLISGGWISDYNGTPAWALSVRYALLCGAIAAIAIIRPLSLRYRFGKTKGGEDTGDCVTKSFGIEDDIPAEVDAEKLASVDSSGLRKLNYYSTRSKRPSVFVDSVAVLCALLFAVTTASFVMTYGHPYGCLIDGNIHHTRGVIVNNGVLQLRSQDYERLPVLEGQYLLWPLPAAAAGLALVTGGAAAWIREKNRRPRVSAAWK